MRAATAPIGNTCATRIDKALRLKVISLLEQGAITAAEAVYLTGVTYSTVDSWMRFRQINWRKARQDKVRRMLDLVIVRVE